METRSILFSTGVAGALYVLITWLLKVFRKSNFPPAVPGFPFIGSLVALMNRKHYKVFAKLGEKHGPIFTLRTGSWTYLVVNDAEIAKEVLITKFDLLSDKDMPKPFKMFSSGGHSVALTNYDEKHLVLKKWMKGHLLDMKTVDRNSFLREKGYNTMLDSMFGELNDQSTPAVKILEPRHHIDNLFFTLYMRQVFGFCPDKLYVDGVGTLSKWEMCYLLMEKFMDHATSIDWRDFFPALRRVPNKSFEQPILDSIETKSKIVSAMIAEYRRNSFPEERNPCYLDNLLSGEEPCLSDIQIEQAAWEPILAGVDTGSLTAEWTMYELSRHPDIQERAYQEIRKILGDSDRLFTEDDAAKCPLLMAIFKETMRIYTPFPILSPRLVSKDMEIAGYNVKKNWKVVINAWAINRDPQFWSEPEKWQPDKLMGDYIAPAHKGLKEFLPFAFGAGKRYCPGTRASHIMVPTIVGLLLQHFHWTAPSSAQDLQDDDISLTFRKLLPVQCIATPRPGISERISSTK